MIKTVTKRRESFPHIIRKEAQMEIERKFLIEYPDIEIEEFDYDFDDVDNYDVGKILPVFIFYKDDKEIGRLKGEHKKEELVKIIEENV